MYAFIDENTGWELNVNSAAAGSRWYDLSFTSDDGKTWEIINQDPFDACVEIENIEEYLYHYIPQIDGETVGVVVKCMKDNIDPGLLFWSEDAGKSWEYVGVTK